MPAIKFALKPNLRCLFLYVEDNILKIFNRRLKIFRILSSSYRNRHRRFGLRANLIAGIYNYELETKELEAKVDMKTE